MLLGLMASGCSDSDCADCGGCGIGGPVNEDFLVVSQQGSDENGIPTILLKTWIAGTCKTDPSPSTLLHYENGTISSAVAAPGDSLNTKTVTIDNSGKALWIGTTLSMSYTKPDAMSAEIVFNDAAMKTTVLCHANPKEPATCTVMP